MFYLYDSHTFGRVDFIFWWSQHEDADRYSLNDSGDSDDDDSEESDSEGGDDDDHKYNKAQTAS